ncbi:MAG: hypothetical protein AAGM46_27620, partial [Cyanobacteria bacterium J06582_2]
SPLSTGFRDGQTHTTESCTTALATWISTFGLPDIITSDRGPNFTSSLWSAINTSLGIQHNTTTAYNPEANGLVERFHRTLKAALMSHCSTGNWFHHLPWVLLGLRTTPKSADDVSPSERVFREMSALCIFLVEKNSHFLKIYPNLKRLYLLI